MKILLILPLACIGFAAQAQTATPALERREAKQQERIEGGVQSGALTPSEAGRLEHREAHLEAKKRAAMADGVVTPAERKNLHATATRNSQAISRKKHNARRQ